MFRTGWRTQIWQDLDQKWDVIVIGGGITGAAVFRRSVSAGYKTLLLEARDFSFGTSSRSSKLVHGGFRYLRNRQYDITKESVREREWMIKAAPNLVTPMGFFLPYTSLKRQFEFGLGVITYDLLALKWRHRHFSQRKLLQTVPELSGLGLTHAYRYEDAVVDDARLVLRMIQETVQDGGTALSYASVVRLLRDGSGKVAGIAVEDQGSSSLGSKELNARVVVNAAGPWSDKLRAQVGGAERIRPLRGSHLIFSPAKLPLPYAVTLLHPRDHRAMFAIPWEGKILFGTTDLDHASDYVSGEPWCTQEETSYMLEAANATFPTAGLSEADIISSFAGLRPIIRGDASDPSKESRAHVVWTEEGLITITGGKLTIFRIMAEQTIQAVAEALGTPPKPIEKWFKQVKLKTSHAPVEVERVSYIVGRYGTEAGLASGVIESDRWKPISGTLNFWGELRYNALFGGVEHLDDLLLRRVRIGMLLPQGAKRQMEQIRQVVQSELGWDDTRWQQEIARYENIYNRYYSSKAVGS